MIRYRAFLVFLCCFLGSLSIFGCGGGGDGGGGGSNSVTLQGRVDDGQPRSPIANAACRLNDLKGTQIATVTADGNGVFQFVQVPLNTQGFIRCTPPKMPHLAMSAFVFTVGRTAGETITNITVSPATTMVAAVISNTNPADPPARATALTAALAAGDADLSLLAQAATALYNAQLASGMDVSFSSGSDSSSGDTGGGSGDTGGGGGGAADGGGTGGDAGDGGAFSPLPSAVCDFALTMDGPMMRNATLADFLANGTIGRPDLQAIAAQVNAAFAGRQTALAAAFNRLFPKGLGQPITATADAKGSYFLSTPAGVPGFVRCNPSNAANLIIARFARARQTGEQLMGQNVTPATTVDSMVVMDAMRAGLDSVTIQNDLLAALAPLKIFLSEDRNSNGTLDPGEDVNGDGMLARFARAQLTTGATLPNPNAALLDLAAITIFDTKRLQTSTSQANTPTTSTLSTFENSLRDYFRQDTAEVIPQTVLETVVASPDPLRLVVDTTLDQNQSVIGLGHNDIAQAVSTGTIVGTVTDPNGTPLTGVQVVATQRGATVQMAQTDATGRFTLARVPPGSTTVTATLRSAQDSMTLTVIAVQTFTLRFRLAPAPLPTVTSVTVSPSTASVIVGQTQQFNATVQGTGSFSNAVHWFVNDVAGGNTTLGMISTSGLYTAPSTVPSANPVTVKAVSDADATKSSSAQVTITTPPSPIVVTVTPSTASVAAGQTQQFMAAVQGTSNQAVNWNVDGGSAAFGIISTTGLYTAPSTVPSPTNTVMVRAVSVADPTKSGTAQVTITPGITTFIPAVRATQGGQDIVGMVLSGAPPVGATPGPPTLQRQSLACPGGTAVVHLTSNTPFTEIAVDVQGVGSFWHILFPTSTQAADVLVSLAQTLPSPFAFEYRLGTAQGPLGQAVIQMLDTNCGGTGDVQVSLTWDTPTDVDLSVRDPNNVLIDLTNKRPTNSAGSLDRDALCGSNSNLENITWPTGSAPNGTYSVMVNLFTACGNQGANFVVTLNVRGRPQQVFTGTFTPSDARQPRTITTFTLP